MASATPKISLSVSRDIPFNKLLLSTSNVRRIKAGVSIEQLADDIARRTLLQSLTVRPVLDESGAETGMYEIPAGGRRYRALDLLVRQKRLAKTAPIPCVIRTGGLAEEDSLAENVQRSPLHPLDQFRAFLALREKGQSEEEIAAAFFVSVTVVKQRLRLASVSPKLLDAYADDLLSLEQVMAFTVSGDHARQEQVWERLQSAYGKEPHTIRRLLTEGAVRASDKRVRFIGAEAYKAAGGLVLRDLFQGDDGGWLQDVALVERLVAERLEREAAVIRAEGWRWIEVAPDFPYGHSFGLRQLRGEDVPLTAAEQAERDALQAEYDQLEEMHGADEDLPEAVEQRLAAIEEALGLLDERPVMFEPAEIARAGAFVSIDSDGRLRVERGYVRPEDEAPAAAEPDDAADTAMPEADAAPAAATAARVGTGGAAISAAPDPEAEPEEDDGIKPLPDRLMAELTTHRTLALRHAIGEQPRVAFLAALHALCLKLFYPYAQDTCLALDLKQVAFAAQAPGLSETEPARAIADRHQGWAAALPREAADLWDALAARDDDTRQRLFAHCVGCSVNAVHEAWNRRPRALAHADQLAEAVRLDMAAAGGGPQGSAATAGGRLAGGWTPTVENYLGRVTKARILQAVRESKGQPAVERIAHLKKAEMAEQAQALLAGSGWLPEPLRTPGVGLAAVAAVSDAAVSDAAGEQKATSEEREADGPTEDPTGDQAGDDSEDATEDWRSAAD
jgi:ParB family chromosome partitioning protein